MDGEDADNHELPEVIPLKKKNLRKEDLTAGFRKGRSYASHHKYFTKDMSRQIIPKEWVSLRLFLSYISFPRT